jgi:hypothetical protein
MKKKLKRFPLENSLTLNEIAIIEMGEKQYLKGKGVNWKKVKRG